VGICKECTYFLEKNGSSNNLTKREKVGEEKSKVEIIGQAQDAGKKGGNFASPAGKSVRLLSIHYREKEGGDLYVRRKDSQEVKSLSM